MTERLNITEDEYRGLNKPSYSLFKRIAEIGPWALKSKQKFDSEAVDFGSLLDCKLLAPEEFKNKFYFDATNKPTAQLLELAERILLIYGDDLSIVDNQTALEVANELNLFGAVKDETKRIAKFDNPEFWNYIDVFKKAEGKTIFTPETLEECSNAEIILKTHPNTARFFRENNGVEYLYQVMIVSRIKGVKVKVMIDLLEINHNNKTITAYDLKATEMHQLAFKHHFVKMKYYLQGSLYKEVLHNYIRDELRLGYALEDFKFIVYSRSDRYPSIWNMSLEWHYRGLNGFNNVYGESEQGIYELIDDYVFYSEHPEVEVNRAISLNNILEL